MERSRSMRKPNRHRSFMSRLSDAILPSPQKYSSEPQPSSSHVKAVKEKNNSLIMYDEEPGVLRYDAEYSDEPNYSTVQELNLSQKPDDFNPPPVPPKNIEALYATVQKKKKSDDGKEKVPNHKHRSRQKTNVASHGKGIEESSEVISDKGLKFDSVSSECCMPFPAQRSTRDQKKPMPSRSVSHKQGSVRKTNFEEEIYKLKLKHQDDLHKLRKEIRQADQENEILRNKVMELLKQENKWKQEMAEAKIVKQENQYTVESNTELNRRISKLEEDTKQEVQLLLDQVNLVRHEKEIIAEQFRTLQQEHQLLQRNYNKIVLERKKMISIEQHLKDINENQRLLDKTKEMYEEQINKLRDKYLSVEEEKNSSIIQLQLVEEENKKLTAENNSFKKSLAEMKTSKSLLTEDLENVKQHEHEALDLLGTLLKLAEEVMTERDVVLKKSVLQEEQRKMIHSTTIDYSMNVGRLQEHIAVTRRQMNAQLQGLLSSIQQKDKELSSMKQSYEHQIDILKGKIVQQNYALSHLTTDKRKLEVDLENLLNAANFTSETSANSEKMSQIISENKD